jgi:hypothetical protein
MPISISLALEVWIKLKGFANDYAHVRTLFNRLLLAVIFLCVCVNNTYDVFPFYFRLLYLS